MSEFPHWQYPATAGTCAYCEKFCKRSLGRHYNSCQVRKLVLKGKLALVRPPVAGGSNAAANAATAKSNVKVPILFGLTPPLTACLSQMTDNMGTKPVPSNSAAMTNNVIEVSLP